jgi:hypothetical protein
VPGSVHSSPSGELPFLVLPTTEIVPLHKIHHLIVSKFEIPANPKATVFLNLVDTKIHAAWVPNTLLFWALMREVYAHFLTEDFEKSVIPLLNVPEGLSPLQYLVRYSARAARKKELEKRCLKGIRQDVIYGDAEDAFAALSTLLGTDAYFFNERYHHRKPLQFAFLFCSFLRFRSLITVGNQGFLMWLCLHMY